MTRYQTLNGFVIGRQNFGEADRILRLFTREEGRIDVVARGVRKAQAKLAGKVEPFFEVEWRLVAGKSLPTVIGAELRSSQRPNELTQLEFGWSVLEITDHSFQIDEGNERWYEFLQQSLMDRSAEDHALIWLTALAKSLDQLGLSPELPTHQEQHVFRIADGQLNEGGMGIELQSNFVKLWQLAREWPLEKLLKVRGGADVALTGIDALEQFWVYHSGKRLQSRLLR